jgi:hypothetical protein
MTRKTYVHTIQPAAPTLNIKVSLMAIGQKIRFSNFAKYEDFMTFIYEISRNFAVITFCQKFVRNMNHTVTQSQLKTSPGSRQSTRKPAEPVDFWKRNCCSLGGRQRELAVGILSKAGIGASTT